MHPVRTGDIATAMLMARFMQHGYTVLKPVSELERYDLVIDRGNGFERIQCKAGRLKDGVIRFNACSRHHHNGKGQQSYRGQIEAFGVYCDELDACYLVPVDDVGQSNGFLRIETAKNNQKTNVRYAENYVL